MHQKYNSWLTVSEYLTIGPFKLEEPASAKCCCGPMGVLQITCMRRFKDNCNFGLALSLPSHYENCLDMSIGRWETYAAVCQLQQPITSWPLTHLRHTVIHVLLYVNEALQLFVTQHYCSNGSLAQFLIAVTHIKYFNFLFFVFHCLEYKTNRHQREY